jgi:hypothetical protein
MITAAEIQTIRHNDPGAVLPGIDTMTGNPYAASSLLDVTKITQKTTAPYYYSPSRNAVIVNQAGAVLSGINFGDATVLIQANNVTVKNCSFTDTASFWAIAQNAAISGAVVANCTFTGSKSPTESTVWIVSKLGITIEDNTFLNSPADSIAIQQGVVAGNYFSGEGYSTGAHGDAIYIPDTTGPVTITDNFIEETPNAGAQGLSNTDIRITDEGGANTAGVIISGNYLLGAGFAFEVGMANASPISNVSVTNNAIGFNLYGQYYTGTTNYATVTGTKVVDFSNPTDSNNALATYQAVPTTNSPPPSVPAPTTVFGYGVAAAHLAAASSGATNFVGGMGSQLLFGAQGANILTYLAIGEGGDRMSAFDPAKDVIDLSHIDADITTPGVQTFTFIGDAPFSGGAQVRYQLNPQPNPANDTTTVQVALAGDATADLSITLVGGLTPLTAANFALTPSQSSADLANGAALTFKKITTAAGAPLEYAYANVQGKAFTSYESFYGSTYENLAADDLNLSSNANELVLYDPTQTVTRGGGAETLQVAGMGSDPLAYHPVETIDATTSGGEQFIFSAGFGKETIKGFNASGASPDSIQLATSAFSYLTPGMTQAQDLAAVLSQATRGPSGLTISDTHGDSLTIAGLTPSMLAVNPAMLQFT